MLLPEMIIWGSTMLLIERAKTISIIGATMFNIDVTMIYIIFTKIGVVCFGVKKV